MQVRCPHCHVPFESVEQASWADMLCPACGSSFSLTGVNATCTYRPGVQVLGHFELLQEVGAGRFGSVWKARDTQLQRIVAIKIPRQRDLDPKETDVFLRDARAAAQLNHPRIAGVHEVGREDNTVFIVTDYIDGANLSEWLTGQQLTSRESAELVVKIAEALHHAHQAGVVHRDLKPSNIMLDREGEPHVIDFGLARRESGEIAMTVEGQVLGTPAYMSPEQARGEGYQADRRSDVYSLGVILFELLTGELPFRGDARMLIVQILDEEPPSPRKLKGTVSRDLETITLRCLQKDPAKRYQTAQELADDLNRSLKGEPIKARPIGRVQRAWRWCRRNPAIAGMAAAVFAILTVGIVTSSYFAVSASREAKAAKLQEKRAERVNAFFTEEVIGLADPSRAGRAGIGLVEALDLAAGKIDERFPDDPEQRALVHDRFGEAYSGIDEPKKAIEQLEEAVSLRSTLAGALNPSTMKSRSNLGLALYGANQFSDAKAVLESTLADQSKVLGEGHPDTIQTGINLGLVLMDSYDKDDLTRAEKTYRQAREALGPRHPLTLDAQTTYAWVLRWHGQMEKSLEFAEPAAVGLREVKGAEYPRAMSAAYNYGVCLGQLGRCKEAAAVFEPLLAVRYHVLGPTHVDSLWTAWRLADCRQMAGDKSGALAVLEEVHANLKSIETMENIRRSDPLQYIARKYVGLERTDRAAEIHAVIYRMYVEALRRGDPRKIDFSALQRFVADLADAPQAELRNYDQAVELATKACELTAYKDPNAITALAFALAAHGDYEAAIKNLDRGGDLQPGDATNGFTQEAAAFGRYMQPGDVRNQYQRALIRVRGGDLAGYRVSCAAMSKQFAAATDAKQRHWFAWTCGLGPAAVDDLEVPLKIAQDLVAKAPDESTYDKSTCLDSLGTLLYRKAEYEEAAKRLSESIAVAGKKGSATTSVVYPQFFLAMTKWKLGDKAEAQRLLAKAQATMDEEMKTTPLWNSRATLELFRREAEAQLSESNAGSSVDEPK